MRNVNRIGVALSLMRRAQRNTTDAAEAARIDDAIKSLDAALWRAMEVDTSAPNPATPCACGQCEPCHATFAVHALAHSIEDRLP